MPHPRSLSAASGLRGRLSTCLHFCTGPTTASTIFLDPSGMSSPCPLRLQLQASMSICQRGPGPLPGYLPAWAPASPLGLPGPPHSGPLTPRAPASVPSAPGQIPVHVTAQFAHHHLQEALLRLGHDPGPLASFTLPGLYPIAASTGATEQGWDLPPVPPGIDPCFTKPSPVHAGM